LRLKDVSLDRPVQLALSARLDNKPVSLEGKIGPVGKDPGKGTIPFDIAIKALEQVDMGLRGRVTDLATQQLFDIAFQVSPFSPRKLIAALDQSLPLTTADPEALNNITLNASIKGNPNDVTISEATMDLDQSKLKFSLRAKEFSKPDIAFDLNLDQIDVDRYLPPPSEKKPVEKKKEAKPGLGIKKKTDYTPLRSLVLDGTIKVGKLKAKGARIQDIHMKIIAKNGMINMDPLMLKLYQGDMGVKGIFDVREDTPKSNMSFNMQRVRVGPFLQDFMKKDILEGTVQSKIEISMSGDEPEMIKRTLNGKGDLLFEDGAVVGIDLAGMVRNIKTTFGLAEKSGEKPRTDFSELHVPFTITKGLVNTPGTSMKSPLLRLLAAGKADIVKETLDFRIEPKLVATIKGQGDTTQRGGITVPVLVTGTFSEPKFRPDLKGMFKNKLKEGISDPSKLKDMIKEGGSESLKETGKEMLKGLFRP
ncbi:MAG: AsmA-like C-terminal region-containing protein, partial [Thermodesulfobacteriota bacterium]|nr:AsmA-like C-terminal region-containing protein [Thermodesulfobacteriota bacterium]